MKRPLSLLVSLVILGSIAAAPRIVWAADQSTTIYRDEFGIPHIFASNLEDASYAAGYAQAEDRLEELLKNYRRAAGTMAELGNLTRFLTYHDHHGYRAEARRLYAQLGTAARDWHGSDLEAARQACTNKLDFAKLLPRAEDCLG